MDLMERMTGEDRLKVGSSGRLFLYKVVSLRLPQMLEKSLRGVGSIGYQEAYDFPRGNTDVPSKCHLPIC
jgi:hypothetical protein